MEKSNNYHENKFGTPDEWKKIYERAYLETLKEMIEERFLGRESYQAVYEKIDQQPDKVTAFEAEKIHKKLMEFDKIEDLLNFARDTLMIELTTDDEKILNQSALEITKDIFDGKHNF